MKNLGQTFPFDGTDRFLRQFFEEWAAKSNCQLSTGDLADMELRSKLNGCSDLLMAEVA